MGHGVMKTTVHDIPPNKEPADSFAMNVLSFKAKTKH